MVLAVALPFLTELVAVCTACVVVAFVCFRLRIPPIIGFLLGGVLIGPNGLGLVYDQELVGMLAEIGVILLLFTIGVEFSLDKLARLKREIMIGGSVQVVSAVLVTAILLIFFGFDWRQSVFTGFLVALSSTAIVLGSLNERRETETPTGKVSLAILILQDMAIVGMVLLVPVLAGDGDSPAGVAKALGLAVVLIAVVLFLARKVVPIILERIVRTRRMDVFLLAVVTICFGAAALANLVGVSLALGAFLAGLVVSESHYSEQALAEVIPLRVVFNAMFFASVGMLLDIRYLIEHPGLVIGVGVGVALLKALTAGGAVRLLGYPISIVFAVGLGLAQIGEFSFVLERAGHTLGLDPAGGDQLFIAVTVLLMLATPALMYTGKRVGNRMAGAGDEANNPESALLEDHVVIVGLGHAGQRLSRVLEDVHVPFVVIDLNPMALRQLREHGVATVFGDATRHTILEAAGIERAKVMVVAISDQDATRRLTAVARYLNPTLMIVARTRLLREVDALRTAGADIVVPEELETTVRIFSHVLGAYMVPPEEIEAQSRALRAEDYGILRGSIQEAHLMVLEGLDEEGLHTRAVAIRPGSPAGGQTLSELGLRQQFGLSVLAVRRDGKTIANPAGEFQIQPNDRLVMIGMAERFAEAANLFRAEKAPPI